MGMAMDHEYFFDTKGCDTVRNLGVETRFSMEVHNYTMDDIDFIVSGTGKEIDKVDFFRCADLINYNPGYGLECIKPVEIYFKDGCWFSRGEYDGSEWWEYHGGRPRPTEKLETDQIELSEFITRYYLDSEDYDD